ncbi:uncharacterized protein LOC114662281 [Erpetoichthys calabaricus]|uniref:uncharacterized protein LOC114662281 n=1 Tax=Erpetoichthys calabaricus TaxID=27687 RepID=UPI002234B874|nr:uncharacterized protein LOC114662281 [Erpetoichthys calabaricus]
MGLRKTIWLLVGLLFSAPIQITPLEQQCQAQQSACLDDSFVLQCNVPELHGRKAMYVSWKKQDRKLVEYSRGESGTKTSGWTGYHLNPGCFGLGDISLGISKVNDSDAGSYQYNVETDKGRYQGNVELHVCMNLVVECKQPRTTIEKGDAIITCQTGKLCGEKLINVTWTKDNMILAEYYMQDMQWLVSESLRFRLPRDFFRDGNVSLIISNVQEEDQGTYRYSVGTANAYVQGEVKLKVNCKLSYLWWLLILIMVTVLVLGIIICKACKKIQKILITSQMERLTELAGE